MTTKKKRGQLIVIDGSDGSGKATQAGLLVRRLRKDGHIVRTMDFPQYDKNFFGTVIGACLHDPQTHFVDVDPRIISVLYAADRWESKKKIEKWLAQGCVVILDRYVSANQIHQGGKILQNKKRTQFLAWLDHMEYTVFALPRPDKVIYLDVPTSMAMTLLQKSGKKLDQAEEDVLYLKRSRQSALALAQKEKWIHIICVRKKILRSVEDIHEEIYKNIH